MNNKTTQQKYLPEFIYGSIDGLVTTFAIVTGVMGAALAPTVILVLGFANVLADGFSMGSSNYLSQTSENKMDEKHKDTHKHPMRAGVVTFISFVIVGSIPLLSFVAAPMFGWTTLIAFYVSVVLTAIMFIVVGYIEGSISNSSKIRSATQTLAVGIIAAAISYAVGNFVSGLVG